MGASGAGHPSWTLRGTGRYGGQAPPGHPGGPAPGPGPRLPGHRRPGERLARPHRPRGTVVGQHGPCSCRNGAPDPAEGLRALNVASGRKRQSPSRQDSPSPERPRTREYSGGVGEAIQEGPGHQAVRSPGRLVRGWRGWSRTLPEAVPLLGGMVLRCPLHGHPLPPGMPGGRVQEAPGHARCSLPGVRQTLSDPGVAQAVLRGRLPSPLLADEEEEPIPAPRGRAVTLRGNAKPGSTDQPPESSQWTLFRAEIQGTRLTSRGPAVLRAGDGPNPGLTGGGHHRPVPRLPRTYRASQRRLPIAVAHAAARLLARDRWERFLVGPDTLLRWHRELVGGRRRRSRRPGRPPLHPSIKGLIPRLGRENPRWGYLRIRGELLKLGVDVSAIATVLRQS